MNREKNRFDWSDVWIFLCITSRDGVSLDHIIAAADILNHAIPIKAEFEKAINNLSSASLVRVENELFILTETGYQFQEIRRNKKGGLFSLVDRMEKYINRQELPIINVPEFKLRPNQLDNAYDIYHKRVEKISQKSRKRN